MTTMVSCNSESKYCNMFFNLIIYFCLDDEEDDEGQDEDEDDEEDEEEVYMATGLNDIQDDDEEEEEDEEEDQEDDEDDDEGAVRLTRQIDGHDLPSANADGRHDYSTSSHTGRRLRNVNDLTESEQLAMDEALFNAEENEVDDINNEDDNDNQIYSDGDVDGRQMEESDGQEDDDDEENEEVDELLSGTFSFLPRAGGAQRVEYDNADEDGDEEDEEEDDESGQQQHMGTFHFTGNDQNHIEAFISQLFNSAIGSRSDSSNGYVIISRLL